MKTIFYLLLIISLSSCSFYKVTGQSPYQYTSVSEQIIVEDQFYNEPIIYFNYVPTFSFANYYSWSWWGPNRRFYYWMYPSVNYWGWNSWNYNPYTYYPYYLNNWGYYNNLYHPYTFNPYFYQSHHGFNNFNPGCNSPFYQQTNNNWKKGLNQSQIGFNKSVNNKTNYTSQKPQHTNYSSDNSPKKSLELNQVNYERPKQDLRNYNDSKYNSPSRNTETRTYEQPKKVEQRIQVTQPERPTYQRQERTYQSRPNYETPKSNYQPSNRPSYNQTPRISSPSRQPSRQLTQPRTNYGGTRSNFGVKGGR